ncbi:MAG: pantetheine-phosphate adenylyltransferase [Bacteroidales bacterium]|jgi:pantetheine-phosphate adenylyltransferase|nr:pantetheine-phosphate adenylyltransferase [Bacteroidales bacterium]
MKKTAVFPGSFDPITVGHESIISRASDIFDNIIVAIGVNADKKCLFPLEKRMEWVKKTVSKYKNITVDTYSELTVDYCKKQNAQYIIRGLRTSADFEFERCIAQTNKMLLSDIENIFFLSQPEHSSVSSSVVREILQYKGNIEKFVPKGLSKEMEEFLQ